MAIRAMFCLAFGIVGVIGVFWALYGRNRLFQFPFHISLTTAIYLLPQAAVSIWAETVVPTDAYCLTLFHGTNCILMAYLGYFQYKTPPPVHRVKYNSRRLFQAGTFWVLVGIGGYVALDYFVYDGFLNAYSADKGRYTIDFTGLPVQLTYISRLSLPGIMMILISVMARVTTMRILVMIIGLSYPMLDVVLGGRRYMLAMIIMTFVVPMFFVRNVVPPRWAILPGLVLVMAATVIMPAIRMDVGIDQGYAALFELDVEQAFRHHYQPEQLELPYHMLSVAAVMKLWNYGWGIDFYNSIIKQFVSRSLFGEGLQKRLFLPGADPESSQLEVYGVAGKYYLAESGIIDSFWEFSFAGCLLFFFVGRIFRHMWDRTQRDRDIRFMVANCLFLWIAPFLMYGGFLSGFIRWIPMMVVFVTVHWWSYVRETKSAPVFARSPGVRPPVPGRPQAPPTGRGMGRRGPVPAWRPGIRPMTRRPVSTR